MLLLQIFLLCATLLSEFPVNTEKLGYLLSINGINYLSEFNELNNLLEAKVSSNDVQANMNFALNGLHEIISHETSKRGASFLEAYQLFTGLSAFGSNIACDSNNFNTLIQNYRAIGMRSRHINPRKANKESFRRIERIFIEYATEYSKKCQATYPDLLRKRLRLVNLKHLVMINQLTAFVLKKFKKSPKLGKDENSEMFMLAGSPSKLVPKLRDGQFIFETLKNQVMLNSEYEYIYLKPQRDYKNGVDSLDQKKLEKLFKNYMISPCESLIGALEPVYDQSSFLALWQHEIMTSELDYYRKWVSYNICYILSQNSMKYFSAIRDFASTLSRENSSNE